MQLRPLAAAAAAAAVALAVTGCNMLTPQATLIQYDPSDGVSGATGTVEIHNAMLIGEADGEAVSLAVTFTNAGEATSLEVRVDDEAQEIRVPQGITVYGTDEQLVFPVGGELEYGSLRNVSFQADGAEPEGLEVPLISTESIVPESLAPAAPAESPEPSESPAPSESPQP